MQYMMLPAKRMVHDLPKIMQLSTRMEVEVSDLFSVNGRMGCRKRQMYQKCFF